MSSGFVLSFLFYCNQLCQAALMKLLIQFMSVHCFPGILKDFYNLYFKSSSLLLCRRSIKCIYLVLLWTSFVRGVQGDYRETGLVLTNSQIALRKNILITKRASDAEPGATSSSNGDLSPVNPIKCLLHWKEQKWNTGPASSCSCQNHSLFHAATIWSLDPSHSGGWLQHLLKSNTRTGKVHEACQADSSYDRWSVETKVMN